MELLQLLELPFRTTASHATFRLAVPDGNGEPAGVPALLRRWAIVWLPQLLPTALAVWSVGSTETGAFVAAAVLLVLWIGAALHAVLHPHRGLHDRLAGTWVGRR